MSSSMDHTSSSCISWKSTLSAGEMLCGAFMPIIAIMEVIFYAVAECFDQHPSSRVSRNRRRHGSLDLSKLAKGSHFTINEIELLYEHFKTLSSSIIDDGLIHKEELQLALLKTQLGENLFLDRVFDLFDEKRNGVIEFEEFIHALSVFHPCASLEEKIDFSFRLHDLRRTGYIEPEELKQMVIEILTELDMELSDELQELIINKTFSDVDVDKDGKINKKEWMDFVFKHPNLLRNMTLPYLKEIATVFPSFVFNTDVEDQVQSWKLLV